MHGNCTIENELWNLSKVKFGSMLGENISHGQLHFDWCDRCKGLLENTKMRCCVARFVKKENVRAVGCIDIKVVDYDSRKSILRNSNR